MNTKTASQNSTKTNRTIWAWSDVYQDRYGDEYLKHHVALCDIDGEPVGKIYNCNTRETAARLAENMANDRNLELVTDLIW